MSGPSVGTSIAVLGMPSTGKTTFLAAVYQALCSAPPDAAQHLARLPSQRAYLEEIRDAWIAGRSVNRNPVGTGEVVEVEVATDAGTISVRIPDIAGESFESAILNRRVDQVLHDYIRDADGLVLFMHPDEVRPRVSVAQANAMRVLVGDDDPAQQDVRDFDIVDLPPEVRLVDLLQWAISIRDAQPTRMMLIISAWDQVLEPEPATWLAAAMPLLHQFLATNVAALDTRIVGVSAQGGDYTQDPDLPAKAPGQRPFVVASDGSMTRNVLDPLVWAATG